MQSLFGSWDGSTIFEIRDPETLSELLSSRIEFVNMLDPILALTVEDVDTMKSIRESVPVRVAELENSGIDMVVLALALARSYAIMLERNAENRREEILAIESEFEEQSARIKTPMKALMRGVIFAKSFVRELEK